MASVPQPPVLVTFGDDYAGEIVETAYTQWSTIARQAFATAEQLAGEIGDVPITEVAFNANFDPQLALPGFDAPVAPVVPTAGLVFNAPPVPTAPPIVDIGSYTPDAAPVFNQAAPTLILPPSPIIAPVTAPGAAPTLVTPTLPDAPTLTFPTVPTLAELNLPTPPNIQLPVFNAVAPIFDAPVPTENFSFTPAQYVDALLTQTKSVIGSMLEGQVLPPPVAQAIRDRAYTQTNNEEQLAVENAFDDIASRGFFEPNGLLNRKIVEARNTAIMARSSTNRDVFVQEQTVAIENLRFAVTSGIQMEGQLISLFTSEIQLQFEAAKYALDVALQIFNARVTVFNAETQAFQAAAGVYRDLIQGALAQAQIYATQISAVHEQGEINQQLVSLYTAQLQAVDTMVDVYKSQLQGAETISRINVANIQGYAAEVGAYTAQLQGQATQWSAYKTQIDAQVSKVDFYNASVQAYGETVRAFSATENVKVEAAKLQIEQSKAALDGWEATVTKYDTQLKGELARLQSVVETFSSQTEIYKATAQVVEAAGEYDNRRFQLNLSQEQAIVDTELKRADASFEQMKYVTSVMVEIKKTLATVQAQLASAAMSAVNIGASVSHSSSNSMGYSMSLGYAGTLADSDPDS